MQFARVYYSSKSAPGRVESGDLYFSGKRPLLVLTWRKHRGERVPDDCIELDPQKLTRASSNGTVFRYEGRVERR
jgi:hypothetical protein